MGGSPHLTPVTVSKLETTTMSNTTTINDQLLQFAVAFDQLASQGGQSPYNTTVTTISVLDALTSGYTLSDPTTEYGKAVKVLTNPSGKSVKLQSSGNTTIVIKMASADAEFTIDGKTVKVKQGKMKGYVI